MARAYASLAQYRRLAYRLQRGLLSPATLDANLPEKSLNSDLFSWLLKEASEATYTDPLFGLAVAQVAQAEAGRSGAPLQQARAGYVLTCGLNRADDWDGALAQAGETRRQFASLGREVEAARCDWQAAYAMRYLAEYRRAEEMAARAERTFRRNHDAAWLGRALVERARNLNQLDQLDESGVLLTEARRLFEQLGAAAGIAWCNLAEAARLAQAGRHAAAIPGIEHAWLAFRRLGNPVNEAWAEFQLGYVTSQLRDYDRAVESLEGAARRFRRLGLRFRYALALNQLGATLLDQGKFDRAHNLLTGALALFQRIQPCGMYSGLVRTNLGLANIMTGELAAAEELIDAARAVFARLDSPRWRASAEACLGYLNREQGRFDNAICWVESAAHIWRQVGDEYNAALASEELAELYLLIGDGEAGAALLRESLRYYQTSGRPEDIARAHIHLANLHIAGGRPAEALPVLQAASDFAATIRSDWLGARVEHGLGEALAGLERLEEADQHLGLAVALYDKQHLCSERAGAALRWAELGWRLGKPDSARRILQEVRSGRGLASPELAWRYHLLQARLASSPAKALAEYRAAIAALQTARRSLSREELAGVYLADRRVVFDEAMALVLRQGDPVAALEIAEESRAQTLAGRLRRSSRAAPRRPGPRSDAVRRRDRARTSLRLWHRQAAGRVGPLGSGLSRQPNPDHLVRRYSLAAAAVQREAAVGLHDPAGWTPFRWQAFCGRAAEVLLPGWRGLAYQQLDDRLLIFEYSAAGVDVHEAEPVLCGDSVAEATAALVGGGRSRYLRRSGEELRRRLYDRLVPPATASRLRADQLLLILPCGPLNSLPFHALQAPNGQYLVEQAVVGYAPSLLTVDLLARRRAEIAPGRRWRSGSLCLVAHTAGADGQSALPAARREVEALTATFRSHLHGLFDDQATVGELARLSQSGKLAEYEYLHLLAHGQFDERSGRGSRLALADGGLLVDDVADLRLRARVVTLSACDSGLREVYPGEEWVGLAQAFLAAGADCVVSGLWRMADEAMPWLMRLFYQNLLAGCGPAAALCAAQRKALKVDREPYYWAPLTAVGLP